MKKYFLNLWHKILSTYAHNEVELLKKDTQDILFQYECYKDWYNCLLLLWLSQNKLKGYIIKETADELILSLIIDNHTLILPVSQYKDILKNVIKLPYKRQEITYETLSDYKTNTLILYRYMLKQVLKEYKE